MFRSPIFSEIKVLKQDERTLEGQLLTFKMPDLKDGPSNDWFFIAQEGMIVKKDANNNFNIPPELDRFSSINAFGIANLAMFIYNASMQNLKQFYKGKNKSFDKALSNWENKRPIGIFPHDKPDAANAYYRPTQAGGELHFFSFNDKRRRIHTCRSFDVVAHETGHAILDILRPDFNRSGRLQTKGLHESWGDLTAIFTILWNSELRKDLLNITEGNLHKKSFLPTIAEEFNHRKGLRNADNKIKINNVVCEEHALSQVFTGAIYDLLARSFDALKHNNPNFAQDPLLERVQKDLLHLVLRAFIEVPYSNPSFSDIGKMIEKIAAEEKNRFGYIYQFIQKAFSERGIDINRPHNDDDWCDVKQPLKNGSTVGSICGTLNHLWPSKVEESPKTEDDSGLFRYFKMLFIKEGQSSGRKGRHTPRGLG